MNDVQKEVFKTYLEIQRICERHNLNYFAIGGTCIGAVRHHGFIPWDDDIDIAMPVSDYLEFIDYAKLELQWPYSLYLPEDNPHWTQFFIKVQNCETTYLENDSLIYDDRMTGVSVDIMPMFGLPQSIYKRKLILLELEISLFLNRHIRIPYEGTRTYMNFFVKLISLIFGNFRQDVNFFYHKFLNKYKEYLFSRSDKVLFGWRSEWIIKRYSSFSYLVVADYYDFSSALIFQFENDIIKVPVGYHHYLSEEFGEYMVIPPVDKQINHQPYLIDLEKPFTFYRRG